MLDFQGEEWICEQRGVLREGRGIFIDFGQKYLRDCNGSKGQGSWGQKMGLRSFKGKEGGVRVF